MNKENADKIIQASRNRNQPYMIDYEHQSCAASSGGNIAPAAGWFGGLKWKEGEGLFMTDISWTEKASKMIAANEYRYISPLFGFDKKTGEIQEVVNVALVNSPALLGLTDLSVASLKDHNASSYLIGEFSLAAARKEFDHSIQGLDFDTREKLTRFFNCGLGLPS